MHVQEGECGFLGRRARQPMLVALWLYCNLEQAQHPTMSHAGCWDVPVGLWPVLPHQL
jgi:hypothetical protein